MYSFRLRPDGSTSFPYASPAMLNNFGIDPRTVETDASAAFALVHPRDVEALREGIARSARTMEPWHAEFRVLHPREGELWFEGVSHPNAEADGSVIWHGYLLDVTEARKAAEALRESEERFAIMFRSSPVPLAVSEIDTGVFIDANEESEKLWGYKREEMIGKSSHELKIWMNDDDRERTVAALQKTGSVRNATVRMSSNVSGPRDCLWSLEKATLGGRAVILSSLLDVTENLRAERALKKSEQRFSMAFHLSPMPNVLTDIDAGIIMDVNDTFIVTFGYSREELVGVSAVELRLWRDPEMRARIEARLRAEGTVREIEVQLLTKSGAVREAIWSGELFHVGERALMLSVFYDITERKQLEERLLHAQKMEAVGRLAGGIAHDFNNMIGVILGFASLMEEKMGPSDPMAADVQHILSAAQSSANLTKQLLAFARKQVAMPVPLDLGTTVASMRTMLTRLIGEDIGLAIHAQEGLWTVKVDPSQIDQILANLATNARDAIENVGSIVIEASNAVVDASSANEHLEAAGSEYVVLSFTDSGKGMDEATKARLFEPYFTTKPKERGTGLGLATIFGIMQQNNGFISVHSEKGLGTTFKLYFPRFYGSAERRTVEKEREPVEGTGTILVVEDERQLLTLSSIALRKGGYAVIPFSSPKKAVDFLTASSQAVDLLITDMVMPEMNGKELSARLSSLRPGMKTLYMSGYPANVIAERGLLEEGIHFLQKPFKPMDLLLMVHRVLAG